MKTFTETNSSGFEFWSDAHLSSFNFWNGAKYNATKLTSEQLNEVDKILEDCYPDGMSETQLNNIFWFDFGTVLEWIGLEECDQCGEIHEIGEICECEEGQ